MEKRTWKLVYSDYSGMEKKAIELVSAEMGAHLNRDKGVFSLHVFPCVKVTEITDFNAVVVGCYDTNELIRKYIKKDEIPENGYVVKVMDNPDNEALKIMIVAALEQRNVFYGAVELVDDYFSFAAPAHGGLRMVDEIFLQEKMPDYYHASAPKFKTRSVFTWGQPILDYRNYIENMARLKLNQLIIWNDFVPVNAKEMIEYAHSCNIKVIWGFSWLWDTNCTLVDMDNLYDSIDGILQKFEKEYYPLNVDGIYFQSFTELRTDKIGDVLIADAVTKFVNKTASRFFEKFGEMELQFGIHATSVKEKLSYIKNLDPRVRLYWEDCGSFPFSYIPKDIETYDETKEFVIKTTSLRESEKFGAVTKGLVWLDWKEFEHLPGSFYIGKCSKPVIHNRVERKRRIWRYIQAYWLTNADKAYDMIKTMCSKTDGDLYLTALVEDGMFEENIMFPVALYSEMLWNTNGDLKEMISDVSLRSYTEFA